MRVQSSNGRELVEPFPRTRDSLQELHVHLEAVAGPLLLAALPPLRVLAVLLVGRQTRHSVSLQDAVHGRGRQRDAVEAPQVVPNFAGAEVVVLSEVQNLREHLSRCRPWRAMRHG
jgi:hypothetical protein